MLIAVQELRLHEVEFDQRYGAGEFPMPDTEIERMGAVRLQGLARLAGDGIRLQGHLYGELFPHCARCLEPMRIEIDRELDLLYQPESLIAESGEVEIHRPDTDLAFFGGAGIELEDVAREQLLLDLPMQMLCGPDCRGLCARCGANLNQGDCACPAVVDERWSRLKTLGQERN